MELTGRPLRLLVTGSRNWDNREVLYNTLDEINPWTICHGQCVYGGADIMADDWARERNVHCVQFPADWYPDGPDGAKDYYAGKRRNRLMLAEFKPDFVVAFKNGFDWEFRRGGTEDMVKVAMQENVPYAVIDLAPRGQMTLPST